MAADETDPRPGDTDNNLLRKILLRLKSAFSGGGTTVPVPLPVIVEPGDIEIGAVEIKNSTTDDRVSIINSAPAANDFGMVVRNIPSGVQAVDGSGFTQPISGVIDVSDRAGRLVGHVSVDNFPATQPVSGTVAVSNFPATQPVSGTVTANQGTPNSLANAWPVELSDGTFLLGTAAHPVRTDPTGTTIQPVSGTVAVSNFPATQPVSGTVAVSNFPALQVVTGNKTNNSAILDATNFGVLPARANAASPSWTENFLVALSVDLIGNLRTINPVQLPAGLIGGRLDTNIGSWLGSTAPTVGQKTMANSIPVTLASDQTSLAVTVGNFPATQPVSGTVAVSNFPATQPVSGTVTANQGTPNSLANAWPVELSDGTFLLGTSAHPVRTDPTGTTVQPVSGTVSIGNFPTSEADGFVSTVNSSTTPLALAGVFTGAGEDVTLWASVTVSIFSDGDANGTGKGLFLEFSPDNVNWNVYYKTSYTGGTNTTVEIPAFQQFFRVQFFNNNGASGTQTIFRLQTIFKAAPATGDTIGVSPIGTEMGLVVRNIPSGVQLVDGSATVQPVSGTVAVNNFPATQVISGAKSNNAVVPGATNLGVLPAVATTAAPSYTNTFQVALSTDLSGNTRVINPVQLPAGLIGGRFDTNIGSWLGSTAPTVGQKTMANSIPVVLASDQTSLPVTVGNFPATQPVSGTVAVSNFPATQVIAGAKSNNAVVPGTTNLGVLPAVANAAPPAWTETFQVVLSEDLSGNLRTINPVQLPAALIGGRLDTNIGSWFGSVVPTVGQKTMANSIPVTLASDQTTLNTSSTLTGLKSNNAVVPGATNLGVLPAVANAAPPTWTETFQVVLSEDLSGNLRTINPVQLPSALIANRLDTNIGSWFGSVVPTVGQKTMANSIPVTLASDQTALAVTGPLTDTQLRASAVPIVGNKTNNTAAPGATNIGTLPALANAAAPTWTEGDQVALSEDLSGNLRTLVSNFPATQTVAGNKTNNNAAPGATNIGVLPALANAASPTWTEGDQVLESVDLTGRQRVRGTLTNNNAAPAADQQAVMPALANAAAPTWTEGDQVLESVDLKGNQRVAIRGNAGAILDGVITAATAPANGVATLVEYVSTAPALTTGQSVMIQANSSGSLFVRDARRSDIASKPTTISLTVTATTVVSAPAAGLFADISRLYISATPAATTALVFTATLSDGTNSYIFDMDTGTVASAVGAPLNLAFDPPLKATTAATAWTIALSVSTVVVHVTTNAVLSTAS